MPDTAEPPPCRPSEDVTIRRRIKLTASDTDWVVGAAMSVELNFNAYGFVFTSIGSDARQ